MEAADRKPRLWDAEALLSSLAILGAVVFFCLQLRAIAWPLVDDAAISAAFAQTAAEGHGFRATVHSQPVEAFSNPTWTLLLLLAARLHLPVLAFAQWAGAGLTACSLALVALWGPVGMRRPLRVQDAVGPWLLATFPSLTGWATAGLEVGLCVFLFALLGLWLQGALRTGAGPEARGKRWAATGLVLALLALSRPELPLLAGLVVLRGVAELRRAPGRCTVALLVTFLLPVAAWQLLRWALFADLLPNTFYAKQTWAFGPRAYLSGFVQRYPAFMGLSLLGSVAGLFGGPISRRASACALAMMGTELLFAWMAKGDWMGEWRFLMPMAPAMAAGAWAGLERARRASLPALGVAAVLALVACVQDFRQTEKVRASPPFPYAFVLRNAQALEAQLASFGQRRPLLAMPDLGGLSMTFRSAEIVDVAGLADYAIAHHSRNPRAQEDYLVSEGIPTVVDAHGPSGGLRNAPRLMSELRPWRGGLFLARGLSPEDDTRCPGGRAAVLALDAAQLLEAIDRRSREEDAPTALRLWRCAWAYQPESKLPDAARRLQLAQQVDARARLAESRGALLVALRQASLATLLSGGDPHRRRYTEQLRARAFP